MAVHNEMSIKNNKYYPNIHSNIVNALNQILGQLDYNHPSQFSVFMPLVTVSRMMFPENTFELGGLCLRQVAHCCRIMGQLDDSFYESTLFQQCQIALVDIGQWLGWYDTTVIRWLHFARGHSTER